jgi:hypothetical protein
LTQRLVYTKSQKRGIVLILRGYFPMVPRRKKQVAFLHYS